MSKTESGDRRMLSIRKVRGFLGAQLSWTKAVPVVRDRPPPGMTQAEAILRLNSFSKWLIAAMVVLGGFYIWSLFVSDRYQALCQLPYWSSTSSQIGSCDEIKIELPNYK